MLPQFRVQPFGQVAGVIDGFIAIGPEVCGCENPLDFSHGDFPLLSEADDGGDPVLVHAEGDASAAARRWARYWNSV